MKTAIILGATGLTGNLLLQNLLSDPHFSKIILFSRRSVGIHHAKIEEHVIDVFKLENYSHLFKADVVYCCIGTTKARTPDKDMYVKIDFGIPVTAAKVAALNGIKRFVVISAMGANPESKVFYNRLKGEMEQAVLSQKIKDIYILRPSLIAGEREENRLTEGIAIIFMKILNFIIPKNYQSIEASTIAEAMRVLATLDYPKEIISSAEIKEIAKKIN